MTKDFQIKSTDVLKLANILRACGVRAGVTIQVAGQRDTIHGTVRTIVGPESEGSPDVITPDCRLHISAESELFVPLRDIKDVDYDERGSLWLSVVSLPA